MPAGGALAPLGAGMPAAQPLAREEYVQKHKPRMEFQPWSTPAFDDRAMQSQPEPVFSSRQRAGVRHRLETDIGVCEVARYAPIAGHLGTGDAVAQVGHGAPVEHVDADLEDVSPPDLVTATVTVAARLGPERGDAPPAGVRSDTTDS